MLKEISEIEGVVEVTGEYTGRLGSYAASHEHRPYDKRRVITTGEAYNESGSSSASILEQKIRATTSHKSAKQTGKNYKGAIYTAVGIAGAKHWQVL